MQKVREGLFICSDGKNCAKESACSPRNILIEECVSHEPHVDRVWESAGMESCEVWFKTATYSECEASGKTVGVTTRCIWPYQSELGYMYFPLVKGTEDEEENSPEERINFKHDFNLKQY